MRSEERGSTPRVGTVYLVGAGPGDPGLLTRRGAELLTGAQAVVFDRLGTEALMDLVPVGAERVYVGKQPGKKAASQEEIHEILGEMAGRGLDVVRLKGGDPFIFGRGGEEALYLRQRGIPFEVVPGVTSGVAAPAYAGIPVTQRAMAVGVTLFTAHEDPTKGESQLHLESLGQPGTTGVFYMGRRNLPRICARLQELGRAPETPVALIEWGTYPRQRCVTGTLETITRRAEEEGLVPPCITVVGEVVGLREELAWFDRRPLFGRSIVVTRARAQSSDLVRRLQALGAEVLEAPMIQLEPPEDPERLRRAVREVGGYQWILFTSVNAVDRFFQALREDGGDARRLGDARLAAVGSATSAALARHGLRADLEPERYQAEGLLEALEGQYQAGDRFLLPRAASAREVLPEALRARGVEVDVVPVYRTVCAPVEDSVRERLREGGVDAVTFTSSSTVENFHQALGEHSEDAYRVASIGPVTSAKARELGYPVHWEAEEATIDGLVQALVEGLGSRS